MGYRVEKRRQLSWLKRYKRLLRVVALTVGGVLLTIGVAGAVGMTVRARPMQVVREARTGRAGSTASGRMTMPPVTAVP